MFNYYIAHIGITNCIADVRLNDVPLFLGSERGYQSFSLPLNPCIDHNGKQLLTIVMTPPSWQNDNDNNEESGNESSIWVEVTLFDGKSNTLDRRETVVASRLYSENKSFPLSIKHDEKIFQASIDNPVTRWHDCINLNDGRDIQSPVLTYYNRLLKVFKNKQYDTYNSLIATREKELVKALGLDENEIINRQRMLEDTLSQGFEAVSMTGEEKIHFFAGGRALSLLTMDNKPALRFFNNQTGEFLGLDLMLGIKQGTRQFAII